MTSSWDNSIEVMGSCEFLSLRQCLECPVIGIILIAKHSAVLMNRWELIQRGLSEWEQKIISGQVDQQGPVDRAQRCTSTSTLSGALQMRWVSIMLCM